MVVGERENSVFIAEITIETLGDFHICMEKEVSNKRIK